MKILPNCLTVLMITTSILPGAAQKVGIGTNTPAFPLDVAGRMHFYHNGQQTPGFYFDGALSTHRAFLGHSDENHIGLYGATAGWVLAMNFYNGNTSVGHSLPTATLDVDGGIRLRTPGAAVGAAVTSADASGNATWTKAVAFKVAGSPDPGDINSGPNLQNGVWVKPQFTNIPEYNIGLAWEPINQVFVAPRDGVFHFDGHFQAGSTTAELACRIIRNRNGVDTDVYTNVHRNTVSSTVLTGPAKADFCVDLALDAGDKIRVELRGASSQYGSSVNPYPASMHFSGRLVTAL